MTPTLTHMMTSSPHKEATATIDDRFLFPYSAGEPRRTRTYNPLIKSQRVERSVGGQWRFLMLQTRPFTRVGAQKWTLPPCHMTHGLTHGCPPPARPEPKTLEGRKATMKAYYRTQSRNSGKVHAYAEAGDDFYSTYCGRTLDPFDSQWEETDADITCGTCRNGLHASKYYRIARDLVEVCEGLVQDMKDRPGAYIHADKSALSTIEAICQRSHSHIAI